MKLTFFAKIAHGKLQMLNRELMACQLCAMPEGNVQITIEQRRSKRTERQNNYYWGGVLPPMAEHSGFTPKEMHEALREEFLLVKTIKYNGREVKVCKSTTDLNTAEFTEYLDRVIAEAADMGVRILTPDEYFQGEEL